MYIHIILIKSVGNIQKTHFSLKLNQKGRLFNNLQNLVVFLVDKNIIYKRTINYFFKGKLRTEKSETPLEMHASNSNTVLALLLPKTKKETAYSK